MMKWQILNHLKNFTIDMMNGLENDFSNLHFAQTIFHDLPEIKKVEPVKVQFGDRSFVVIRLKRMHRILQKVFKDANKKAIRNK